ncbi:class I SAM-dependent methyltransferase [Streptomyces sp. JW3]|uniref:class I SAM-dependent methyltransferase n=1 Tax=Streptomyces sp. JW3 TaxID=3456955 RepID=UPI003FA43B61
MIPRESGAATAAHDLIQTYLRGINDPLLAPFGSLPEGAHVVDLACGTGEPSLPLARRRPDLRITGIDVDPALLAEARAKAGREDIATVEFHEMSMIETTFADASVDGIVSRMGLLLAGLAPFGPAAREAARVLRPEGLLTLATWTDAASNPYTGIALPVLRQVLPAGAVPDFESSFADSAEEGALEKHLVAAGFTHIAASWFSWETECPDFETWWEFNTSAGRLNSFFASLDPEQRATARRVMADNISGYQTDSGGFRIPATCRIITAQR